MRWGPSARKRYDIDDDIPTVAWDFSVSLMIPKRRSRPAAVPALGE